MGISTERPKYHFTPPQGWMNDPCAPFWDEKEGVYHVWYQYVPNHTEWDCEIGWGHAWTRDFRNWESDTTPALMPFLGSYDDQGVFTGNLDVRTIGKEKMVAMYSCINELARKMKAEGYQWSQERLALATSSDGGKTWTKDSSNPLPLYPPKHVTGWRDPFIFPSPSLDSFTQSTRSRHYCIISGGIKDQGPTVFLYALPYAVEDLDKDWEYLGPLIRPSPRPEEPHSDWCGDRGWNWECAGLFTLPSAPSSFHSAASQSKEGELQWLIIGSEGKWVNSLQDRLPHEWGEVEKPPMWQLWFAGPLQSADAPPAGSSGEGYTPAEKGVEVDIKLEGVLDWGCLYATQTFPAADGRRLMIAWLPDDDLSPNGRERQGWAGSFSTTRELFQQTLESVVGTLATPLDRLPGFEVTKTRGEGSTLRTLGMRPAREILEGRKGHVDFTKGHSTPSAAWEVCLSAEVQGLEEVGIELLFAGGLSADVVFIPSQETILVRRNKSVPAGETEDINVAPEHGRHTLMKFSNGEWEKLVMQVFWDGTILEVFANERFALSTHLYGGACGMRVIQKAGDGNGGPDVKVEGWSY